MIDYKSVLLWILVSFVVGLLVVSYGENFDKFDSAQRSLATWIISIPLSWYVWNDLTRRYFKEANQ